MDDTAQLAWLTSAVDALEGIHASEVAAVSAELRRSITRHNQIVPAIADKVAERRRRRVETGALDAINAERIRNGLGEVHFVNGKPEFTDPPSRSVGTRPLTEREIDYMPEWLRGIGKSVGFLVERDGKLVDSTR